MSTASFGVIESGPTVAGDALNCLFGMPYGCSLSATIVSAQDPALQAICVHSTCPIAPNVTCSSYTTAEKPSIAISSLIPSATANSSMPATISTTASIILGFSIAALATRFAAMLP
ncbi:hypothetical protein M430DRAFT_39549 [Amorphotheca resinae ATCC 22711]|uniref:Uncharacterized protein n=1 Tax=Amorphotheca resinae ATCC 22711 TaxID=857342 RepID=A0A2T3BAV8_AMORE|nr:hypothetical protein M430DRAFT_39549 [Amorphotheca resinae ATCC 22711]PSS25467.1 hypothetical protein M430DRAFT_39549 [Amorphotheca resinae ATCC 22711]